MDQEVHDEEEEDTSAGTLEEKRPSLLPVVGDTIVPIGGTLAIGGTLVFCQEVPTYHLIQVMNKILAHIVSRSMHNQGLEENYDLK